MPNSRFGPSPFHGLCAIFAFESRFIRLFQVPLDTCLDRPFLGLRFTAYARWEIVQHGTKQLQEICSAAQGNGERGTVPRTSQHFSDFLDPSNKKSHPKNF